MEIEEYRKKAYEIVLDILKIIQEDNKEEFLEILDTVKFRIKSKQSIISKGQQKGISVLEVYDLIGIRYVVKKMRFQKKLKRKIINNSEFIVNEVKDYTKTGHPDDSNYKAIHIRMNYKEFLCEIQIMDITMIQLEEKTHDKYKKGLLKK